jgi:cell division protein ZapA (FtsZ GTPase activity inhibitor)
VQAKEPALALPPGTPEHQQLEKDTAQLLHLVRELKVEVDKAGTDTLSLAAIRKADEIQKLTKNLKERMREREQEPGNKPRSAVSSNEDVRVK